MHKFMQTKTLPFILDALFFDKLYKDPSYAGNDFWFIFNEQHLLVHAESLEPFQLDKTLCLRPLYMGAFDSWHFYVGEFSDEAPQGAKWADLKELYGKVSDVTYSLAGRAAQLSLWNRTHQFCGRCGRPTNARPHERAKECKPCNLLVFPRICPAIMALVQKDDEILLARSSHFPEKVYSVLAGFLNPGETLEECVKREVYEEVGLDVDEIHYFGSQPWPFPNLLMIAFTCRWKSGEIKMDPKELEDARWFKKTHLPALTSSMSLARTLIESVLDSFVSSR